MTTEFSLLYGDKQYTLSAAPGARHTLGDGVSVCVEGRTYEEYDAVEWVLYLENTSSERSAVFSDIFDCDTLLPLSMPPAKRPGYMPKVGDPCVIAMNGMVNGHYYWENDRVSASEYGFRYEYLAKAKEGKKSFQNIGARSSEGTMPFFDVTAMGNGYIAAIGWTGDWRAEFTECKDGIRIKTGLKETRFFLNAGERLRTSSILLMRYGSKEDKYNKLRRLIKSHFSHRACTQVARDGLMAFELWGGLPSEEMKKRLGQLRAHDIKVEDIWIDAGWYGDCTKCDEPFSGDWSQKTGDWNVNFRVHPDELRDVSACAQEMGARLMLWLEPERAVQGTGMTLAHPEWFLRVPGERSLILNYGCDEARSYAFDTLSHYVKSLSLSCYRQDFNIPLGEFFRQNDEEDRRGITEIKHITGMYALWDALLDAFPGLIIDNCASGGRRIDIETLRRSVPFFRSDYQCNFNENSEVLQVHNTGISHYLPYNGCTSKTKNDLYAIRSSYSSSWGAAFYNAIFHSMEEEDFAWMKRVTDEYRAVRRYFTMDFYNHASCVFDESAWTVWQYHDSETQSGIVMAFRREQSPFDRIDISLKGVLGERSYTLYDFDKGECSTVKGRVEITLPEKRSCALLEYRLADN